MICLNPFGLRVAFCVVFAVPSALVAAEQEPSFLGVSSVEQPLNDSRGRAIIQLRRGELMTVLLQDDQKWLVQTTAGTKGWVPRQNVLRLADAGPLYDELIKAHPSESAWYALRAMVWEQRGENDKAIADLDRAIQLGHEDPHLHVNRGMFHAAAGKYDKAVADYDEALKKGLDDTLIYSSRAGALLSMGKFDLAIRDCDEVIRREPNKTSAFYLRGVAWRQTGEMDKAISDFSTVLKQQPEHIQARISRGFIYYLKDEPARAIEDFSEVIRRQPENAVAYNNRGYNRQLLASYKEALADFEKALQLAPEYGLAYQNKAWLLATCPDDGIRDGLKAFAAAKKACELREWKVPSDWKALAAAYAEAGDFVNALKWQNKVVAAMEGEEQQREREILAEYQKGQPHREGSER